MAASALFLQRFPLANNGFIGWFRNNFFRHAPPPLTPIPRLHRLRLGRVCRGRVRQLAAGELHRVGDGRGGLPERLLARHPAREHDCQEQGGD